MSGGTWDYDDYRLVDLAERVREGARGHSEDSEPLEFPTARAVVADLLDAVAGLLHQLDWHYAGDTCIPYEQEWLDAAKSSIRAIVTDPEGCVCAIGAQECPVHPGNTRTKEEKIQFRKDYDAAVDRGVS